jgi:UDP-4-amino-4,6-dideoxy-N-acetyl-beta-L-altrosamine N-acetyltransferase
LKHKLYLRNVKKSDLILLRDWRNSKHILEFSGQFKLLNLEDQKKWFTELKNKDSDKIMFVIIDESKKSLGVCGLTHINYKTHSADVAILLGDVTVHGKGVGEESLKLLIEYGFKKINLHRIKAEIFEFNTASIKLFEKVKFKQEAILKDSLWRDGRWWNTYVYSIFANDY